MPRVEEEFREEVWQWVRDYYLGEWRVLPRPKYPLFTLVGLVVLAIAAGVAMVWAITVLWPARSPEARLWRNVCLLALMAPPGFVWGLRIIHILHVRVLVLWCRRAQRCTDRHMAHLTALGGDDINALKILMNVSRRCDLTSFAQDVREQYGTGGALARWSFLQELYQRWGV